LNQRIREIDGFESVFVYPNMGDGGCGTGAAMLAFDRSTLPVRPLGTVFHGPDYSRAQIEAALRRENLAYDRCDDIEGRVAELLTQDCVVGRFNGRMEYGPRALGNRSILYPAGNPEMNRGLNQQLGRTEFIPFAPAVLADAAPRMFHKLSGCEKAAEFMTVTFDCTDEMKLLCPAAVQVDGTTRPQLVNEQSNSSLCRILRCYEALSGVPAVINTSFKFHDEPIVCTPDDAVQAFLLGNIDYLAIGPYLAPHPQLRQNVDVRQQERPADRRRAVVSTS
jgi:carbamoyltransferase